MTKPLVEQATLENFCKGEGKAFAEVIRAYTPVVRFQVTRFWRSVFQQEEAMQDIWVHAFKRREALDPSRPGEFAAWLATLARNRCIDLLRKEGRTIGPGELDPSEVIERVQESPVQEMAVAATEIREALMAFKARLKPQWLTFFRLHFEQGLGYQEIGKRLSISQTRCKYMKRVLIGKAKRNVRLVEALGKEPQHEVDDAP